MFVLYMDFGVWGSYAFVMYLYYVVYVGRPQNHDIRYLENAQGIYMSVQYGVHDKCNLLFDRFVKQELFLLDSSELSELWAETGNMPILIKSNPVNFFHPIHRQLSPPCCTQAYAAQPQ